MTRYLALIVAAIATLMLLMFEARFHFDEDRLVAKRSAWSAQRDWNAFLSQQSVYRDASLRYDDDFAAIRAITEPGQIVFSDMATSYYLASNTALAIKNIHQHQGREVDREWAVLLKSQALCFLDNPEHKKSVERFISDTKNNSFRYIVINKDQENQNLRRDCYSQRRRAFIENIEPLARLVFDGEYLMLYQIKR